MPTASGAMTAAEKDEKYRAEKVAALAALAAEITTPEQIAADAAAYLASSDGDASQFAQRKFSYPAGAERVMGRTKASHVDEGEARAYALDHYLQDRGHTAHNRWMSFGLFAGRQSVLYGIREYLR